MLESPDRKTRYLSAVVPLTDRLAGGSVFRFAQPCSACGGEHLTPSDVTVPDATRALSTDEIDTLKQLLSDPRSYIFGMMKAAPFIPDFGFVLKSAGECWLFLVDTAAQEGRLVTADDLSPEFAIVNIDPITGKLQTGMLHGLQ
jgi:hypothetical protein